MRRFHFSTQTCGEGWGERSLEIGGVRDWGGPVVPSAAPATQEPAGKTGKTNPYGVRFYWTNVVPILIIQMPPACRCTETATTGLREETATAQRRDSPLFSNLSLVGGLSTLNPMQGMRKF